MADKKATETGKIGSKIKVTAKAHSGGPVRGSMTMKRLDHAAMELQMRAMECSQWIGSTVGVKSLVDAKDQNEFFKLLSDGVALCQLIDKIDKSVGIAFKANAKQGSFQARDNVVQFLDGAKKLGVNPVTLFDPEDLVARKHDKQVVNCLLQLAKIAAIKYKITPPSIVQYEIEIEELEKKRKAGTLKEDEDDLEDDDPQFTTSRAAAQSVSGVAPGASPAPAAGAAAAAAAPAADAKAAPASPTVGAATPTDEPAPIYVPEPEPAAAAAGAGAAAAEAPASPEPAAAAAPASPAPADAGAAASPADKPKKADNKPKYKYLPYKANADSEIDVSVGKVLNNNLFDIDVKTAEIKKKKRARSTKHNKAEYIVAGHRVHVRKIQGMVMVHVGADWISFARFAEDIVVKG